MSVPVAPFIRTPGTVHLVTSAKAPSPLQSHGALRLGHWCSRDKHTSLTHVHKHRGRAAQAGRVFPFPSKKQWRLLESSVCYHLNLNTVVTCWNCLTGKLRPVPEWRCWLRACRDPRLSRRAAHGCPHSPSALLQASFPANLQLVLVLRPTGFFQRTLCDLAFKFNRDDFKMKVPVSTLLPLRRQNGPDCMCDHGRAQGMAAVLSH